MNKIDYSRLFGGSKKPEPDKDYEFVPLSEFSSNDPLIEALDFKREMVKLKAKSEIIDENLFKKIYNNRIKALFHASEDFNDNLNFYMDGGHTRKHSIKKALESAINKYKLYTNDYDELIGDVVKIKEKKVKIDPNAIYDLSNVKAEAPPAHIDVSTSSTTT
jgi:hypothetical protein